MSYSPTPIQIRGGKIEAITSDANAEDLLKEVLVQLKIMNMHLSTMTEDDIDEKEIHDATV